MNAPPRHSGIPPWPPGGAKGIGRSLRLYHRGAERIARMDALHATVLPPGGLAFDIGAHVGDRVSSFRRLGARVVAVEPQPAAVRALRLIHGRDPGVRLVPAAVGAAPGRVRLRINTANPTVTTTSAAFVAAADGAAGWEGQVWDAGVDVPVVTLDRLIAEAGVPDFVKIDVEGAEDAVLAGLSHPVPALSFEMTTIRRGVALACIDRLERLGRCRYALALGESHDPGPWEDAVAMARRIEALPHEANSGDVHARLLGGTGP